LLDVQWKSLFGNTSDFVSVAVVVVVMVVVMVVGESP